MTFLPWGSGVNIPGSGGRVVFESYHLSSLVVSVGGSGGGITKLRCDHYHCGTAVCCRPQKQTENVARVGSKGTSDTPCQPPFLGHGVNSVELLASTPNFLRVNSATLPSTPPPPRHCRAVFPRLRTLSPTDPPPFGL
jgi:hypothetical protein